MSNKPSQVFLRGLDQEDAATATSQFASCDYYREVAVSRLKKKWLGIHKKQVSEISYGSPAWAAQQADANAALRTIEEVMAEIFNVKIEGIPNG